MTLEEAIKLLKQYQGYDPMFPDGETLKHAFDLTDETVDALLSALRPVSREQAEKVWRGEWTPGDSICPICEKNKFDGLDADIWADWMPSFCPNCGAPMTDKAVQMVMERINKMEETEMLEGME